MPLKLVKRPNLRKKIADLDKAELEFLEEVADECIRILEQITGNWKNKPKFKKVKKRKTIQVQVEDNEAGQIFRWVNYGTDDHIVEAKRKNALTITLGYTPKTTPSSFGGPGKAGGPTILRKKAHVKGIKGRFFNRFARKLVMKNKAGDFRKKLSQVFFSFGGKKQ